MIQEKSANLKEKFAFGTAES